LLWQLARRAAHKTKALLTATPRSRAHNPSNFLGLNNLKAAFSGGFFIILFNAIVVIRSLRERRADG
jgi:hypothetical protein